MQLRGWTAMTKVVQPWWPLRGRAWSSWLPGRWREPSWWHCRTERSPPPQCFFQAAGRLSHTALRLWSVCMRPEKKHEHKEKRHKTIGNSLIFALKDCEMILILTNFSTLYFILLVSYLFVNGENCSDRDKTVNVWGAIQRVKAHYVFSLIDNKIKQW